ncbi:hypothetical protein H310_12496 [Aphanomyces invadans]|uniref:WW domain-containing protein n=1 Tax=Aphanomyces invadans TaxID=157072 RepID=A0A024TJF3_9STRA|nr:hypothetical protein H310_12496 [Aphanomyces invadans]ETV93442.1 hypothetical protein H310_12496 [Aphanomyces invadans]|eukprot:XP_008877784.1 hypothetical protein H310_12496 [Aphanomyces invadans]
MDWEPRTNCHGYTYYYHVPTGAMQWTCPDENSLAGADERSDDEEKSAVEVSVQESDSSISSNESDVADDSPANRLLELNPVGMSNAPEHMHRVVLDTFVWLLREVWQSHVEIGQFVAASTRTLLRTVTPSLRHLLSHGSSPPSLHVSPSIPATFIPAKSTATPHAVHDWSTSVEVRPEMPV